MNILMNEIRVGETLIFMIICVQCKPVERLELGAIKS